MPVLVVLLPPGTPVGPLLLPKPLLVCALPLTGTAAAILPGLLAVLVALLPAPVEEGCTILYSTGVKVVVNTTVGQLGAV